jgi:hypothetical protein
MRAILCFARNCWLNHCSCQDHGHKFGCDTVHAISFRLNTLACSITNSHLLSNVVNGPTSILTDELLNSCNSFRSCAACGSPCVFIIANWCANGLEPDMPLKHLRTTQDLVPEGLLNHCEGLRSTYSQDCHKGWCTLAVPYSDLSWKSPQVTYTTPNKHIWKLPTSTQLSATWHTHSLDMVVLPSTGASRYHNCCIDGGTIPEYFWYNLVCGKQCRHDSDLLKIQFLSVVVPWWLVNWYSVLQNVGNTLV